MRLSPDQLRARLERLPRSRLAHLPTPLEPLPRLSAALGGVELWVKRDDATGLAMGGNKARQLEFTLGDALAQGADCIVQGAGSQSNHCRQAAAAAARLGLECHLVLQRDSRAGNLQGNLLLDGLLGAKVHWTEAPLEAIDTEKEALAAKLRSDGRRPYVIGGARGRFLGAAAYVLQACELIEQCAAVGLRPDHVYVCSSGAKTYAGLLLGLRALGHGCPVQGIAPIVWGYDVREQTVRTVGELARELGVEAEVRPEDVRHSEDYVGPAYGVLTREARVAIELVARTEGLLLDPSYTGKAMAGVIDHVRRGLVRPGSRVVFVHTGGTPALFAHAEELLGAAG